MNIIIFSINPLFPNQIMGGAAKHSQAVATQLGALGHRVTVLCTVRDDNRQPFNWGPNVRVIPCLPFKQPFPEPYALPPFVTANILQTVGEHLEGADRFYMHDGEFLFPYAYGHVPTVVSLRDIVYAETMLGGFLFQGDALVAISEYAADVYQATMGRFFPGFEERLVTVNNGIDFERFHPTPPVEILEYVNVDPTREVIILHPHRPEPSKGLPQSIRVLDRLVHEYRIPNVVLLTPRWFDAAISSEVREFYDAMQAEIEGRGLTDHVRFHGWIPQTLMPQYYSLGAVTLVLGHFVEAFGNVAYESLACGTPAVVSRVGPARSILPDDLLDKVHFDDDAEAAARAAALIGAKARTRPETLDALKDGYSVAGQLEGYARLILNAERRGPLAYRLSPSTDDTRYRLAPWCYEWERGFFHDFLAEHRAMPALSLLMQAHPGGFSPRQAAARAVDTAQMRGWVDEGWVVAVG